MENETLKKTEEIPASTVLKHIGLTLLFYLLGVGVLIFVMLMRFTTEVTVQPYYSEREMRLPIFAYAYSASYTGDSARFNTVMSVEKIGNIIRKWDEDAEITIQDKMIFVSRQNPNGKSKDYYFLWRAAKDYRITGMIGMVYSDDESEYILLPYHFLEISAEKVAYNQGMEAGVEYSLQAGIDIHDIARFYEDAGYFDVERNGNEITIIWGNKPVFIKSESHIPSRKIMMEYVEANQSLIVDLSEQAD